MGRLKIRIPLARFARAKALWIGKLCLKSADDEQTGYEFPRFL
jgi:hypothetical protein